MKKTTIVIAVAAVLGLALAAVPALAQNEQRATGQSYGCPLHDQEGMTYADMDRWMDSANHDQMHAAMGDMMGGYGAMPGNMMGGMMGAGMMGAGMMGAGMMGRSG